MKYRHIIWDWNGTLFNDTWLCVELTQTMLGERGLAPGQIQALRDATKQEIEEVVERALAAPVGDRNHALGGVYA